MHIALILSLALAACSSSPTSHVAPAPKERRKKAPPPAAPSGALKLSVKSAAGPVAGAAVWVDELAGKGAPKAAQLRVGASGLSESLLVLPSGSAISVRNELKEGRGLSLRSADAAPEAPELSGRDLPAGGTVGLQLPASGMVDLSCAPVPCGTLRVVLGAAGGITDAAGVVSLGGLAVAPARIHVWHPTLGRLDQTVEVAPDQERAAELVFP